MSRSRLWAWWFTLTHSELSRSPLRHGTWLRVWLSKHIRSGKKYRGGPPGPCATPAPPPRRGRRRRRGGVAAPWSRPWRRSRRQSPRLALKIIQIPVRSCFPNWSSSWHLIVLLLPDELSWLLTLQKSSIFVESAPLAPLWCFNLHSEGINYIGLKNEIIMLHLQTHNLY